MHRAFSSMKFLDQRSMMSADYCCMNTVTPQGSHPDEIPRLADRERHPSP
jgi:hypothetical protein